MALLELLIKSSDNSIPGIEDRRTAKQGMIIDAKPEGFKWGRAELNAKLFLRIKINDNEFNPEWIRPRYVGNVLLYKRSYIIRLSVFLDLQKLTDLKSGIIEKQDNAPFVENISNKIELFDYDTREKEFGTDWYYHTLKGN